MLYLITGGSGSGKSAFAEDLTVKLSACQRVYLATMQPFDEESQDRIRRHRRMRSSKGFETIEKYVDIKGITLDPDTVLLLECMSNLVANEMYSENGAQDSPVESILKGVEKLVRETRHVVIVTNEVFTDIPSEDEETQRYLSCLGQINQALAKMAEDITEVVYGIPIKIKQGGFQ
ncbi:MAG: bifunctional adenosylcobinamide kinase/adenosylcobinamide-phosphate guanylyltransferase [Lachnospiraceae bacterium]